MISLHLQIIHQHKRLLEHLEIRQQKQLKAQEKQ